MMWGMGLFWLLAVIVLILSAAALFKYLFSERKAVDAGDHPDRMHASEETGR